MDAKRVYTVEHISLQDGSVVEVKPLTIKRSREASALLKKFQGIPLTNDDGTPKLDKKGEPETRDMTDEEAEQVLLDIVLIVMRGQDSCQKFLADREELEDSIDSPTIFEIVKIATGVDFLGMMDQMMPGNQANLSGEVN